MLVVELGFLGTDCPIGVQCIVARRLKKTGFSEVLDNQYIEKRVTMVYVYAFYSVNLGYTLIPFLIRSSPRIRSKFVRYDTSVYGIKNKVDQSPREPK